MLRLSFKWPKKDSRPLLVLGMAGSPIKWNILGKALMIDILADLRSVWMYLFLLLSSTICSWINGWWQLSQSTNALSQYCLSVSVFILLICFTRCNNSIPAIDLGCFDSLVSAWCCTWNKHLCTTTFGNTFLIAFSIEGCPSQVMLDSCTPNVLRHSKSSRISS